jgi:hypothetical protein
LQLVATGRKTLPRRNRPNKPSSPVRAQHADTIIACDLFTVDTVRLRRSYALFFLSIGTRRVEYTCYTPHASAASRAAPRAVDPAATGAAPAAGGERPAGTTGRRPRRRTTRAQAASKDGSADATPPPSQPAPPRHRASRPSLCTPREPPRLRKNRDFAPAVVRAGGVRSRLPGIVGGLPAASAEPRPIPGRCPPGRLHGHVPYLLFPACGSSSTE